MASTPPACYWRAGVGHLLMQVGISFFTVHNFFVNHVFASYGLFELDFLFFTSSPLL